MPPYNLLAEEIIVGGILLDPKIIVNIAHKLKPEAFYFLPHKLIYEAIFNLYMSGHPVDLLSIIYSLRSQEILVKVGGIEKILYFMDQTFTNLHFDDYVALIVDKYIRRSLIQYGSNLINSSYSIVPIDTIISTVEKDMADITQSYHYQDLYSMSKLLKTTLSNISNPSLINQVAGIPSGFYGLDAITQGFQNSDLIIIAGRPSMGKTAFCLNIAYNITNAIHIPIAIFSLEMTKQQLIYRLLSISSLIPSNRLQSGRINYDDWSKLYDSISSLSRFKVYLDDTPNLSTTTIRTKTKKLNQQEKNLGLIIIDYLQLIQSSIGEDSRSQELSIITRSLKSLARELNLPVIVLSQLSRNVEVRNNKKPLLSDLRESGCLTGNTLINCIKNELIAIKQFNRYLHRYILNLNFSSFKLIYSDQLKFMYHGFKYVYFLSIARNKIINLTANHKVLTKRGWIRIDNLYIIDQIATLSCPDDINFNFVPLVSINLFSKQLTYDLGVKPFKNFLANTVIVHNSIEQDADLVCMLYREDYYNPQTEYANIAEIIVAKHRNGPTGSFELIFDPYTTTFKNIE
uniref:Replicative DNA helicase n=1 Tax=Corynoplastis japonica TaxID=700918 RepID=A0A1Y9TMG3_9RHOD|nr:replication helicase subunit [Corynoplastis japonica]